MQRVLHALAITLCLAVVSACTQSKPRDYDLGYDPGRNPVTDLKIAMADAAAEDKRILLKLGGDWCSWCQILDDFLAASPKVYAQYQRTFVPMKVNVSKENLNEAFLSRYPRASGYPYFIILDSSGKLVGTQDTGDLEDGGGYSEAKFSAFLSKYEG